MPQSTVQLKSPLLHTLLENLTQSSICTSTAIWHVPNPVNFICQYNDNSFDNKNNLFTDISTNNHNCFNKNLQKYEEKQQITNDYEQQLQWSNEEIHSNQESNEIYTMTFLKLNNAANRVAMNLANYLERKWSSITNKINKTQLNQHSSSIDQPIEFRNQSDTVIALFMPPGIDRIVVQIACMKLHLAYMPLDRNVPAGRISQILNKLKPILILIAKDYYDYIYDDKINKNYHDNITSSIDNNNNNNKSILLKKFSFNDFIIGNLNELKITFQSFDVKIYEYIKLMKLSKYYSRSDIYTASIPIRVCLFPFESDPVVLVLFTSGSTNSCPKPVKLRTTQMFNRLEWQWDSTSDMDLPNFESATCNSNVSVRRIGLAKTAWGFVDAFTELFSCLLAGIPVVVPGGSACPSEKSVTDVQQLINLTKHFKISHITTVPTQMNLWLKQLRLKPKEIVTSHLSSLRTVIVSGDIVHPKMACEFFQLFKNPEMRLINLYGTTEVAGDVTGLVFRSEIDVMKHTKVVPYGLERENNESGKPVLSVGTAIQGTAIFIVQNNDDDHLRHEKDDENQPDKWSNPSLSIIGSVDQKPNWDKFPFKLLPKGHIGHVCILGQQVSDSASSCQRIEALPEDLDCVDTNKRKSDVESCENNSSKEISVFMPGDLGFIDPQTNHLYICGRTNELIKINGIRFHANDIDNLFIELKKNWKAKNMIGCTREELLVNKVSETVTLTIQTVHGRDLKLVCFYVLHMNENRNTMNIEPKENHDKLEDLPKQDDFIAVFSHYLPPYLSPTFINIDHIPLMRTSGKVDKEYLRQYYYSKHYCEISEITKVLQPGWVNDPVKHMTENNNSTSDQSFGKSSRDFKLSRDRERARKVLAEVLGIRGPNGDVIPGKPKDDEDFYLLGGDSLLTVLATEQLRQLGFNVNLDVFTKTGKIGSILTNLQNTESDFLKTQEPFTSDPWTVNKISMNKILKKSHTCNLINRIPLVEDECCLSPTICPQGSYEIFIEQWNDGNFSVTERHEIVDVLVNAFIEKDRLSHALKLDRTDLTEAIEVFLNAHKSNPGIVLTARYYYENPYEHTFVKNKLVGVIISLPAKHVPLLHQTPKLALIQQFFDECSNEDQFEDISMDNLLATQMVAITSQSPYSKSKYLQYMLSNWKKISLKLLTRLERDLLRIAAKQAASVNKVYFLSGCYNLSKFNEIKILAPELRYTIPSTLLTFKNSMSMILRNIMKGIYTISQFSKMVKY
ncbi:hypothetical protein MS3_00001725 [Schistosoma haematobium]|uniref:Uncharacterized protein n=1 Tax=Schistosoma haematobium TaxID=6185 RepID=A0A6A5DAS9_SCHHA|nr:hypothetical protein MS3_00001725 [Schistosoma haematobium]KAH9595812.1 hypothetical protein MS3_00001725 [Schistosoma haematobium]